MADAVALLEGAESGVSAASGMGAIMTGLLTVLQPGDHTLASHEIYGGTLEPTPFSPRNFHGFTLNLN